MIIKQYKLNKEIIKDINFFLLYGSKRLKKRLTKYLNQIAPKIYINMKKMKF